MNPSRKMAIIAVVIAVVVAASGFYLFQLGSQEGEVTKLTWQRTGGFIGLNEELVIESDGSASYSSNHFGDAELVLTEVELKGLLSLLENASFFTLDRSYAAKPGSADYFSYRLTVQTTSDAKTVEWVDGWASEKTIPGGLGDVQLYIQTIIERIHQDMGVSGEADKRAIKIAKDFIVRTIRFTLYVLQRSVSSWIEWIDNPDVMASFSLEELKEISKNLAKLTQPFIEYDCEITSRAQRDLTIREPETPSELIEKAKDKTKVSYIK